MPAPGGPRDPAFAANPGFAAKLRRLIATDGPISLAQYVAESNAHYYATRDPLGAAGDFVTAPEISQMFGEIVGLWLADMWHRAGKPQPVHYVELGPGRGTLASDALRAMRAAGLVPQVHLVEASPALRIRQTEMVPDASFHHDLASLPEDAPLLLVANEFFDALPVRQLVRTADGWREVMVGLEEEAFALVAGTRPMDAAISEAWRDAEEGTLLETSPAAAALMHELASRLARQGGAALVIDYGHAAPRTGSTLQAVRAHAKVDPFAYPGEADLTTHVDFASLVDTAQAAGVRAMPVMQQGEWLRASGMDHRAAALTRAAPQRAAEIESARHRLTAPDQMGALFKVLALASPDWVGRSVF